MLPARTWGTAHHLLPQTLALTMLTWPTEIGQVYGADPTRGDPSQGTKVVAGGAECPGGDSQRLGLSWGPRPLMTLFPLHLALLILITWQSKQGQGKKPCGAFL